jgi:hypothetical protein
MPVNTNPILRSIEHLDQAEASFKDGLERERTFAHALLGIGWALLAIARKA